MKTYTICFMVTGGIAVEAENEDEALAYFHSDAGQEAAWMCIDEHDATVTEIYEEE